MIEVAKKAAIKAGIKTKALHGKIIGVKNKKRLGDFATEADIASEKIIIDVIKKDFPKHNFLSEELGEINNNSDYTWVIDPLDGTIGFTAGLTNFGVSIGLLKNYNPILGVINFPAFNNLFWAEKGKGAFMNRKRVRVSETRELLKSVVGIDLAYVGSRKKELKRLAFPIVDKVRYPPVLGCATLGASYVACGVFEAYIHSAHPWDYVAGAVIVKEAGGKVTDYRGDSINWSKDWIDFFASNGHLHKKILSLIK